MDELREMVEAIEGAGYCWSARYWPSRKQWYVQAWKKGKAWRRSAVVMLMQTPKGPKAFEAFGNDLVDLTRQLMVKGLRYGQEPDTVAQ